MVKEYNGILESMKLINKMIVSLIGTEVMLESVNKICNLKLNLS